jgi:rhamnosyltransferase
MNEYALVSTPRQPPVQTLTRCGVIIPTYNGAHHLPALIGQLRQQSVAADPILVIDSSSVDGSPELARSLGCQVEVIDKASFNHGGTRNRAVALIDAQFLVFLTQDALPCDEHFLARLLSPLQSGVAAASYARQLPYAHAHPPEAIARAWNYPATSSVRAAGDIPRLGVRAYFFSNVASGVRRDRFLAVGGFPHDVIMNEDMVLCAKLLAAGDSVAYCGDAVVRHSHNYSLMQQFRRYFDIGAFFASHGQLLPGSSASGEGLRFARHQFLTLLHAGKLGWALRSPCESAVKFLAFHLGKRNRFLPMMLKRRMSMHAFHWRTPTQDQIR